MSTLDTSVPETVTDPLDAAILDPGETVFEGMFDDEAPATPPATTPPPSVTPDPAPAGTPGDPAVAPPTEPATPPADPVRAAYTVRADGADYEVKGAFLDEQENLVIPKDSRAWVERVMQQGIAHQGSFHQRLATATETGYKKGVEAAAKEHPDVIQAKAVLDELRSYLDGGPEAMAAFFDDFERSKSSLELKQAQALYDAKAAREAPAPAQAEQPTRLEPAIAQAHLVDIVPKLAAMEPTLSMFADPALAAIVAEELSANPASYFYLADEDDPTEDIKVGDILCDFERVGEVMQKRARLLAHVTKQSASIATAKASNAEKLQAAGIAPVTPPAVTTGTPATAVRKLPKTDEEMEAFDLLPLEEQNRIIAANRRR